MEPIVLLTYVFSFYVGYNIVNDIHDYFKIMNAITAVSLQVTQLKDMQSELLENIKNELKELRIKKFE
jgi:hypothetical protein